MTLLVGAALATAAGPRPTRRVRDARGVVVVTAAATVPLAALVLIFLLVVSDVDRCCSAVASSSSGLLRRCRRRGGGPAAPIARALAVQPLRWLGERSYGIYLWHWPIFLVLRPGVDVDAEGWPVQLARFALTFAVAELSYRYVEMPVRHGVVGDAWRRWRAAGGVTLVGRSVLAALTATAVVFALGLGLAHAHEPSLEDALGGVTSVGDEDLDGTDPTAGPVTPSASALPSGSSAGGPSAKPSPAVSLPGSAPPIVLAGSDAFGLPTTALGDSVMLGARDELRSVFRSGPIVVDAKVSRQASELFERIVERKTKGKLGDVVIIHTGTNGTVSTSQLVEMLTYLKDRSRVVLVTCRAPREWTTQANRAIRAAGAQFAHGNVRVADWQDASVGHRDWFYSDGIHAKSKGALAYALLIREALRR